jgi:hypothetical protein
MIKLMSLVPISKFINEQPEWWTDMSVAQQKQYLSTYQKSKHKVVPDNPSGKEERDDIAKQRKHDYSNAPHESEPGFGDSESGYDVNAWNEHYVRRDENGSATIGTAHVSPVNSEDYPGGENDKDYLADKKASDTGRKFVEDNVIPEVDKVMDEAEAQGKEVVFLGEGGQGDGHNYYPGTEQEMVGQHVSDRGGTVDTWDGEYSNHWEDDAPIYDDISKKMGNDPKTGKPYTKSQIKACVYANMVGQGDDPVESMDYLDKEGEQFLRDNGYKGKLPPETPEDIEELKKLAYPGDYDDGVEGPISECQDAYNASRRDNLCKKKKEYENGDPPKVVIVAPGATHAYDLEC